MATPRWSMSFPPPTHNVRVAVVVLNGGDTAEDLHIAAWQDKTVHVFGTFGTSTVSVKGLNDVGGNAMDLHRTDAPSTTYTALAAETLGHILENPFILRVSASSGTGSNLTVVICAATPVF